MGDKIAAKTTVAACGVPIVPGIAEPGLSDADLIAAAADVGFPVLVKPSAGGGGKGMRRVDDPADLAAALAASRREAAAAFGDDTLFLERFVVRPRHIEVQVLADTHGNVLHLGERECSLQRRHQKVIEEAPSAAAGCADPGAYRSGRLRYRAQRRLRRGGHRRVHRLRGPSRRVLLHGDEHPPSGRAPGHRDGHRVGSGRVAGPHRRRGEAAGHAERDHAARTRHRGAGVCRRSRRGVPAHRWARPQGRRADQRGSPPAPSSASIPAWPLA